MFLCVLLWLPSNRSSNVAPQAKAQNASGVWHRDLTASPDRLPQRHLGPKSLVAVHQPL